VGFVFKLVLMVLMLSARSQGFSRHHFPVWFSSGASLLELIIIIIIIFEKGAHYIRMEQDRVSTLAVTCDADCVYRAPFSSIIDVWASMCF
jgi:hypothetical protein